VRSNAGDLGDLRRNLAHGDRGSGRYVPGTAPVDPGAIGAGHRDREAGDVGQVRPGVRRIQQPDLAAFAGASGAEGLDSDLVTRGITAWTSLLGAVSAEVFEHLGPELPYSTTVFDATVALGELLLFGDSRDDLASR
jgi:hypothetical protein